MGSFLDKLRTNPPVRKRVRVWSVDPDLRNLGWALVQASYTVPTTGEPEWEHAEAGVWQAGQASAVGTEQADHMITSLRYFSFERAWAPNQDPGQTVLVAEAQRIYPDPNESPAARIAKANDLLRLAQISGAFQGRFTLGPARSFLPHVWKGNAKKHTMAEQACRRLAGAKIPLALFIGGAPQSMEDPMGAYQQWFKRAGDAFDALCLSLFGADEIASGRWAA